MAEHSKAALEGLAEERGVPPAELVANAVDAYLQGGCEMTAEEMRVALKFVSWLRDAGRNPDVRHFAVMILRMIDREQEG
jgi:hypothetical protein